MALCGFFHVGGPEEIGFGASSDLLLIVSVSGRSVVDCSTGKKVASEYDEPYGAWLDQIRLTAKGIGPLAGQEVRLGGIHGGGLPLLTCDGWLLELVAPDWPYSFLLLQPPLTFVEGHRIDGTKTKVAPRLSDKFPDPVIAYGFSPTGKSFAVMVDDGVEVFYRDDVKDEDQ